MRGDRRHRGRANSTPTTCNNQIAGFPQDLNLTGFATGYSYDALGDLVRVQQPGLADRSFSYDSLGRLLSASNPETGTVRYVWDDDALEANHSPGDLLRRQDAAGVNTSYWYDALHRLTTITYDGATPQRQFHYDEASAFGVSLSNTVGRRSSELINHYGTQSAAVFSYDARGRVLDNSQCTPHNCGSGMFPISYTYDLLGDPTQVVNGVGVAINPSWNRARHLTGVSSSLVDSQHPATLLANVHYGPFGPVAATLGNGVIESRGYTARGWLDSLQAGSLWSLSLGYQPDGTVASANDSVNGSWSYGDDSLNRLQAANCSSHCPGQAAGAALDLGWSYDRSGNRWAQAVTAGAAPAPSAAFTGGNNRIDGWSYDADGNLLADGVHQYGYDAEGRLTTVDGGATASYLYDAEGRRVRRSVGARVHDLLYDRQGHAMTELEYDSSYNGWTRGEIYAGGRHLATYVDGTTDFDHADSLGTERLRTRLDGSVYETCVSLPFGDAQNCSFPNGAASDDPLHFTGQPRDEETGLDDFGARYNNSSLGRWMTPDWSAQAEPVPYAKLDNPQSLNLYAYVLNNPVTLTDADGHTCKDPKKGCTITVQLRAFIPPKSIGEVVGFKGDGRGFTSASNASSRVATTATINTDPSTNGGHPLQSSSTTVQPTTLTTPVGNVQRTASGPQMPQVSASQDKNGNVTLHVTENVRNPFQPAGQGIMANVNITIPQGGASASIMGTLSGSPSFELNVSSQTGPTANIPVAGSSTNSVVFVKNLEEQRQVNVTGQVP